MNEVDALDLLRQAIHASLVISAPAIGAAMVIGLIIALLQALTQIQEMTLTFVPKILAILIAVLVSAPLMGAELNQLAVIVYSRIETGF